MSWYNVINYNFKMCVKKKLHFLVNWIIMNSHKIFSHSHLKVFLSFTVIVLLRCFCKTVPAKVFHLGLPWWSNGEESTCHCRAHRFDPWSGKRPRAVEQPSPCTTSDWARGPRARAPQEERPRRDQPVTRCNWRKARHSNVDPAQPKISRKFLRLKKKDHRPAGWHTD